MNPYVTTTTAYTAFNQPDIAGLNNNLINALVGDDPSGNGLAKESTLLEVLTALADPSSINSTAFFLQAINEALHSTSDGDSAADLLEQIITAASSGGNYQNRANFIAGDSGAITTNTATTVIAAPGASTYIYITSILVTNSHATVGTLVTLRDSDGTTIPGATGYAAPLGGGYSLTFPTPLKMPTANKTLQAICGTTGANVYVSVAGFKGA